MLPATSWCTQTPAAPPRPRVNRVPGLEVPDRANDGGLDNGAGLQPVHIVHRLQRHGIQIQKYHVVEERSNEKMPPVGLLKEAGKIARQFRNTRRSVLGTRPFLAPVKNRYAVRLRLPGNKKKNQDFSGLRAPDPPPSTHPPGYLRKAAQEATRLRQRHARRRSLRRHFRFCLLPEKNR